MNRRFFWYQTFRSSSDLPRSQASTGQFEDRILSRVETTSWPLSEVCPGLSCYCSTELGNRKQQVAHPVIEGILIIPAQGLGSLTLRLIELYHMPVTKYLDMSKCQNKATRKITLQIKQEIPPKHCLITFLSCGSVKLRLLS